MPGPAPRLKVVKEREGQTHSPIPPGLKLPAGEPPEPDWAYVFPEGPEAVLLRREAAAHWALVVPTLVAQGIVSPLDGPRLQDLCVLQATIVACTRRVSREGFVVLGVEGRVRNPASIVANQAREKIRPLIDAFGLTPLARDRMNPREGGDGDGEGLWS